MSVKNPLQSVKFEATFIVHTQVARAAKYAVGRLCGSYSHPVDDSSKFQANDILTQEKF